MPSRLSALGGVLALLVPFAAPSTPLPALFPAPLAAQDAAPLRTGDLRALAPRIIGPAVTGGRVHDLAALPDNASVLYVATASGGLWKTTDRGHTWRNLFDTMAVSTFGDVDLAPSDPDIVYVGTGEENNRQSTSWGNGVYRSDDAGESWRHLGLEETRHIGQVEVHPEDPDVVYVAAAGNLWRPGEERGVYRSTDGGTTWEKVLYVDDVTGAVDLAIDPVNPDVLFAATYQRLRRTWGFNGGGPGSGIHRSTDGGDTWTELTAGLPDEDMGRIGLALAASDPQVVMATIETASNDTEGTYRSEDGGLTWERVNGLNPRPMYYSKIFIDPTTDQRVYVMGTTAYRSEDGGRTFEPIAERPSYDVGVHADHHALSIDRADPDHIFLAGDAGLHESYDRGITFRKINNFPIGQFYDIGIDMADPYRVYGGMQDNHSWMGPSETRRWIGIVADDWQQTGFGDGMYWDTDYSDPRYAYGTSNGGSYFRLDTNTGDMLDITPSELPGEDHRFDWTSPMLVSKHDPRTVYVAGNRLFISHDRGGSWARTDDLTRQIDRDTLELMGVPGAAISISRNDGTGSFGEAVTLDESPVASDVLWVGFDDGNLQVSRDGGTSWTEVSGNVPGIADGTYVSRIMASVRSAGVAYATFDGHRDGDFAPYAFRTDDFGASWRPLHGSLPVDAGSANVILEHPDNPDVLFLGTEHHLYVSGDAGGSWTQMPGLPTTAYDDLAFHPRDKDLVIGTHGRSIWILDDTRPLAEWNAEVAAAPSHLFTPGPGTLFHYWKDTSYRGNAEWHGENPPDGVLLTYRLGPGQGPAVLRVTDGAGTLVREMGVPDAEGLHRVNWDLRHHEPGEEGEMWELEVEPRMARADPGDGPLVSPGTYTVTLAARGREVSRPVAVRADPLLDQLTQADYESREAFLLEVLALDAEAQELEDRLEQAAEAATGQRATELADLAEELDDAVDDAGDGAGALQAGGVRQGSLFPPTATMLAQLEAAREVVARARAAVAGAGGAGR